MADATAEDTLDAVSAAAAALPGWAATAPRERAECLRRAWSLMIAKSDSLARLMVLENGKALPDARAEVTYAAEFFRWYAEEAVRVEGSVLTAPSGANRILVTRQPVPAMREDLLALFDRSELEKYMTEEELPPVPAQAPASGPSAAHEETH